ncbi:MAG: hypothetical protein ABIM62_07395 [candidate division WOR-3 bacterium]
MQKSKLKSFLICLSLTIEFLLLTLNYSYSTPSTQIWNPSTDIQGYKTFHLGIDNYFSITDNRNSPVAFPTDIGLTYGAAKNLEVGIDLFYPSENPVYFNLKYGFPEKNNLPAYAVGVFYVGTKDDVTDYNIFYGVLAKTLKDTGRISLGYYIGNSKLLVDENGNKENTGLIFTIDKVINEKVWTAIDYASGKSFYGNLSFGVSYNFAPNTSVIFGYTIYNNKNINKNNTFTTQLDINF